MHIFTIAVLLFCFAISFSCAETCPEDDRVIGCSFHEKDVCISGYYKSKVTGTSNLLTYKYSDEKQISLTCHATKFRRHTKFYMIWKKGDKVATTKTTCSSQTINIKLLSSATRTNYTCMVILPDYDQSESYMSVIEFVYGPPIITKDEQQNNSLKDTQRKDGKSPLTPKQCILILFVTICVLAAISTIILYVVTNRKKVQKEDKQRLHSQEVTSNSQGNISLNNAQSTPQLCETYATPQTNTASPTIYCDPYVALYSQPIPKSLRNPKNTENNANTYSNGEAISNLNNTTEGYTNLKNVKDSDAEMYSDPSMYNYVS